MYKKRKNYKSLFNKIKKKGNWHFDPSKKSKDAKYLGRIKLSNDIVSGAIKSVEKSPLIPAVQLYKKDLINKAYEKTPVAWGKVDNIQAGYNASNTVAKALDKLLKYNETNKIDVIIISRGGGSFEDLNCFNDECKNSP